MEIYTNVSLKRFNTFGLDYKADYLVLPGSEEEIVDFLARKQDLRIPLLVIGGGSNVLFTGDFHGTILKPAMKAFRIEERNDEHVIVSADAGANWDDFVSWCVENSFGGIENLSWIPGNAGATPIQNIGAYGVEIKDHMVKASTIGISDGSAREFTAGECAFAYRDSIFKNSLKGKYIVTRVYYKLDLHPVFNLSYGSLYDEVKKIGVPSLSTIRQAVISIRKSKLPDPGVTGNAGSFFKNPVVTGRFAEEISREYPSIPVFTEPSGDIKLAAGWLIEQCGWKGKTDGNVLIHHKQALVITNSGKASGQEILDVSEKIRQSVLEKFGISLEREVELIAST